MYPQSGGVLWWMTVAVPDLLSWIPLISVQPRSQPCLHFSCAFFISPCPFVHVSVLSPSPHLIRVLLMAFTCSVSSVCYHMFCLMLLIVLIHVHLIMYVDMTVSWPLFLDMWSWYMYIFALVYTFKSRLKKHWLNKELFWGYWYDHLNFHECVCLWTKFIMNEHLNGIVKATQV